MKICCVSSGSSGLRIKKMTEDGTAVTAINQQSQEICIYEIIHIYYFFP